MGDVVGHARRRGDADQLELLVLDQAEAGVVPLLAVILRIERGAFLDVQQLVESARGHGEGLVETDHLADVFGDTGRDFLKVTRPDQRRAGHQDAGLGAVDAGAPGALVADDLAVFIVVDVLSEIPDVAGLAAGDEEVARHLDQLAVFGLALLDHPRQHAVDPLGLEQRRDGVGDLDDLAVVVFLACEVQSIARPEREVRVAAGGGKGAAATIEVHREVGIVGRDARRQRQRQCQRRHGAPAGGQGGGGHSCSFREMEAWDLRCCRS